MDTSEELEYILIHDEAGQLVKRPRNKLYERVAAIQQSRQSKLSTGLPPLIEVRGAQVSDMIVRERRGDFD